MKLNKANNIINLVREFGVLTRQTPSGEVKLKKVREPYFMACEKSNENGEAVHILIAYEDLFKHDPDHVIEETAHSLQKLLDAGLGSKEVTYT